MVPLVPLRSCRYVSTGLVRWHGNLASSTRYGNLVSRRRECLLVALPQCPYGVYARSECDEELWCYRACSHSPLRDSGWTNTRAGISLSEVRKHHCLCPRVCVWVSASFNNNVPVCPRSLLPGIAEFSPSSRTPGWSVGKAGRSVCRSVGILVE